MNLPEATADDLPARRKAVAAMTMKTAVPAGTEIRKATRRHRAKAGRIVAAIAMMTRMVVMLPVTVAAAAVTTKMVAAGTAMRKAMRRLPVAAGKAIVCVMTRMTIAAAAVIDPSRGFWNQEGKTLLISF